MDEILIFLYITAWFIVTISYWKKRKSLDTGFFLLLFYFILSIFSYYAFKSELDTRLKDFSFLPFVFLFAIELFILSPLLLYNEKRIERSVPPNPHLIDLIAWICIIPNILSIPDAISSLSEGLTRLAFDVASSGEMYLENRDIVESTGHGVHNITSIMCNGFSGITVLLIFYYATLNRKSRLIFSLLLISSVAQAFGSIAQGTRGGLVEYALLMIFTYLLLKQFMPLSIKRWVRIAGISFMALATLAIAALTIGRFGDGDSGAGQATAYYAGQQNLYFNKYAFDNNGIRYGDRTIPLFKRMIGIPNVPHNYAERRNKYPALKINDEAFIGYVGDFMLDFGPIIGTLLLIIQISFVRRNTKVKKKKIYFHQIILLHFTLYMVTIGAIKLYPFADVSGNLQVMVYTSLFIVFYIDYYKKQMLGKIA